MSINISDYYKSILSKVNNLTTTPNISVPTNASGNSTTAASSTDKIDLSTNTSDLSGFLNYNATGSYSSLPTLADFMNTGSDDSMSDLLNPESSDNSDPTNLSDLLNESSSNDGSDSSSIDSMFNMLAQSNTDYSNFLIQQALNKMGATTSQSSKDTTKTDTATDSTKVKST